MSNTTTSAAATPTATELQARFEALQNRGQALAETLQGLAPLKEASQDQQEAFLLAFSDFKLLQKLFEGAQEAANGINILHASKEEIEAAGGIVADIAELAKEVLETMIDQLGVGEAAVRSAIVTDFGRSLDLIETITARAEAQAQIAGKK